jgi:chemotaxis protein methyltransferase CheR
MILEDISTENIEVELLIEAVYQKYGYDFRGYSRASIKRRLKHRLVLSGLPTLTDMQRELLYDPAFFQVLLQDMSINVTEMFRDPIFYKALRETVLPALVSHELIKIWHAGCSTGEEVYSMAILLTELGLYEKSHIYATDFDEIALHKAREGIYPANLLQNYTKNYRDSGGIESFADYYSANYELVKMNKSLKKNVLFSDHNLVSDGVFGDMDLIVCRNVLIYFGRTLQDRVLKLFADSLHAGAYLCLGTKETVRLSCYSDLFENICNREKIYKKTREVCVL